MTEPSQATKEEGPAQDDKKFIGEFNKISTEAILRPYEVKNRERMAEASAIVRFTFDEQWKKVTGGNYYQPQTTIQAPVAAFGVSNVERSDPRSRRYRAKVAFSKIRWQKIRRKISKRWKDLFILSGTVVSTGDERPIFQNLTINRVKELFGDEKTREILKVAKTETVGELEGSFELEVEGYWEVQFSPKKDKNDTPDVRLAWEGQTLIIQRMKPVVLPGFYIEVADNATKDHYVQNPEQGRKKIGVIQEYPYTVLREASREEYLEQKESGDNIMRDVRARQDGA